MRKELEESLKQMLKLPPEAYAQIYGGELYPAIKGTVYFYPLWGGTMIIADIAGLPSSKAPCKEKVFAFHIHEGTSCQSENGEEFGMAKGHFNPENCTHPQHAGDMPPLFGNNGYAYLSFYTNRFLPEEIAGRTVVIHENPDDFKTQPSGNSGTMIACGEIQSNMSE